MSSSHCMGKSRDSRRERVSIRRATASILANGSRGKKSIDDIVGNRNYFFLNFRNT